jgi:mannose-6-phosphate isomerase-like protein (cupin superfamily)
MTTVKYSSVPLPVEPTVHAPDGSEVRVLLALENGSMAHFHLAAATVARAVVHRTVEELWFVLEGRGQMWRSQDGREEVTELVPRVCLSIPVGTQFQFRASPTEAISAVAVTMPPWPGAQEADFVEGPWQATVS